MWLNQCERRVDVWIHELRHHNTYIYSIVSFHIGYDVTKLTFEYVILQTTSTNIASQPNFN